MPGPKPKYTKKQLQELYSGLINEVAVADHLGISRQRAHQLRKKYNILYNVPKKRAAAYSEKYQERNTKIMDRFGAGMSPIKLAKMFKLTKASIDRIIKKYK